VVLDANALFLPLRSALRIESEVERLLGPSQIVVPTSVLGELARLRERGVADASAAAALAERFPSVRSRGRGDEAVRTLARSLGACVLTADRALRARLLEDGTSVVYPRDRSRLALERAAPRAMVKSRPHARSRVTPAERAR
jgi:rRNA-processing protein FCF1